MKYKVCSPKHKWVQIYPLPEGMTEFGIASIRDGYVELNKDWLTKLEAEWTKYLPDDTFSSIQDKKDWIAKLKEVWTTCLSNLNTTDPIDSRVDPTNMPSLSTSDND